MGVFVLVLEELLEMMWTEGNDGGWVDEGGRAGSPIEDEFLSKMKALIYSKAVRVRKHARFMKLKVYFSAPLKKIRILILFFAFVNPH